ncbi:hypothetical protein M9458_052258 [Cirrhinus mrigala]|uniref:Uncharacterized protein n=1 Tax=Cirrhinus mrigala TaxID=683832 RepID=A0ABD0MU85_CIRMR
MNLVGDLRSAHHQMSLSPCHITQTVALHPGLRIRSPLALIASTPVANQACYKSPGLSLRSSRISLCLAFSPGHFVSSVSPSAFLTLARFTDYPSASRFGLCSPLIDPRRYTEYPHVLPLLYPFAFVLTLPVSTMSLSRPMNKSSHLDLLASRLFPLVTEYSGTTGSSSFTHGHSTGMDTTRILFRLKQGPGSLEQHIREFLAISNHSDLPDCILIKIFCDGLNELLKVRLRREGPRSSLAVFLDYALLTVGSSFTVGVTEEQRDIAVTLAVQPARVMAATTDPFRKLAATPERAHVMAVTAVPVHKMVAAPVRAHVMAATAEPVHKMAAKTELRHVTAATPETSKAKAAFPDQVAAVFPESSQVTAVFPESSQVTAVFPESSQVTAVVPVSSRVTAVSPESSKVTAVTPVSSQAAAAVPESSQATAVVPESSQDTAVVSESSRVSAVIPESSKVKAVVPESSKVKAAVPDSSKVKAAVSEPSKVKIVVPVSSKVRTDFPDEPSHVTVGLHESNQVTAVLHKPSRVTADLHDQVKSLLVSTNQVTLQPIMMASVLDPPLVSVRSANIPVASTPSIPTIKEVLLPAAALPLMAVAIWCAWAAHCALEVPSDYKSAPEVPSDHKSASEVPSDHKSASEVPSDHKSAPEVPSDHKSAPGVSFDLRSAPEVSSDHESAPEASPVRGAAPMPPEVSASAVEPPKEAAFTYELSASHLVLSASSLPALPRSQSMTRVPALPWRAPAPPALPWRAPAPPAPPPALPWRAPAPPALPWWAPALPVLPQSPGPLHGPGPLALALFRLV